MHGESGAESAQTEKLTTKTKDKNMTIKELIKSVANLVEERETIDHGTIRCLHSDQGVRDIESCEPDCGEVGTGTVGDDDLAGKLRGIAESDQEGEIDLEALKNLEYAHRGDDIEDYLTADKEDELILLDKLIDAAREVA